MSLNVSQLKSLLQSIGYNKVNYINRKDQIFVLYKKDILNLVDLGESNTNNTDKNISIFSLEFIKSKFYNQNETNNKKIVKNFMQ